jgi:hypothetical protein
MEIKPAYATFQQSKLLKKAGYSNGSNEFYIEYHKTYVYDGDPDHPESQKKADIRLDSGLYIVNNSFSDVSNNYCALYEAPQQWQVVEWFRVKHNIDIEIRVVRTLRQEKAEGYTAFIATPTFEAFSWDLGGTHSTPQEAYSAAIDYILKNLLQ